MKPLKTLISLLPGGRQLAERSSERRRRKKLSALGDTENIFTHYYEVNQWKDPESVSGVGSTLANTKNIRRELPGLLTKFGVRSFLDAPCGDYNWFRELRNEVELSYIGGDIVKPLVDRNQESFGSDDTRFVQLDIVRDALPSVDLWMCRDCLIHLSFADIRAVLRQLFESEIEYLLTTVHTECDINKDIQTGDFRLLNLERPPFSFPEPILYVDDSGENLPARAMGLWRRDELIASLTGSSWFENSD